MFDVAVKPIKRTHKGGSQNPILFRDYESFVEKFTEKEKTTDDCYTPDDVYRAVVDYVGTIADMTDKCILRPFYPGGDYENAEYPDNGVVIDNPPFSILSRIVKFYMAHNIPFFLFGNGMTIMSLCKYGATAVIIGGQIKFHNGAEVRVNFTTNLLPEYVAVTAPTLDAMIKDCPSQNQKVNLPKYRYPYNIVSVSAMQTIAGGGVEYKVRRSEAVLVKSLDLHPKGKGSLFGEHLLVTQAQAKAQAQAQAIIDIELSEREKKIVERLNHDNE